MAKPKPYQPPPELCECCHRPATTTYEGMPSCGRELCELWMETALEFQECHEGGGGTTR